MEKCPPEWPPLLEGQGNGVSGAGKRQRVEEREEDELSTILERMYRWGPPGCPGLGTVTGTAQQHWGPSPLSRYMAALIQASVMSSLVTSPLVSHFPICPRASPSWHSVHLPTAQLRAQPDHTPYRGTSLI